MSNFINEGAELAPVNFKGQKIVYGNVEDLKPDFNLNIRYRAGTSVYGVEVKADTYDLGSLKQRVIDVGYIAEPIWVSVRKDGTKVPVKGNRRTLVGHELLADPALPKDIREALTKKTPMILLENLTAEQERKMVMDQDTKEFSRSELVRYIFGLRGDKWSSEQIAMTCWEGLGKLTGNAKKIAEVRDTTDPAMKRAKIKTWLNGTLNGYYIKAYDLGAFVQKCTILSEMRIDGLQNTEADEKPYFITTKDSQKRFSKLAQAKESDGTKFNGHVPVEGSEFKKVLDQFHAEDYLAVKPKTPPGSQMMKRTDIEGMKDSFQSQCSKQMIDRILGLPAPDINVRDKQAEINESKAQILESFLGKLTPDVEAIVRKCLVDSDPVDFQSFLLKNLKPGETV